MFFLSDGFQIRKRARINSLADRVSARVQNAVRRRVCDQLPAMSIHEARGYIRARSTAVIKREMNILVAEEPSLQPNETRQVAGIVRHRIVRRLLLENLRRIEPARVVRRRVAA